MRAIDKRRYWDSDVFLNWLLDEPGKADKCKGVIHHAEQGNLIIVTSALTLAEVIHLKGKSKLPKSDAKKITKFFENEFIAVRNIDRTIAEHARQLIWDSKVSPKDAIHLATALRLKLTVFDTFDRDLISLDGKLGDPPLRIGNPDLPFQEEIQLNSGGGDTDL